MLKQKKQERYFNKHWEGMFSHLYNYCVGHDPEELHKLRVEMKKIEALFVLSELCVWNKKDAKKFAKYFEPVRTVFKSAGKIRTAYLNLKMIEKYESEDSKFNSKFKEKQNGILMKQSDKFCSHMITFAEIINKNYKPIVKLLRDIESKKIIDIYEKQLKRLDTSLKNYKSSDELHKSRKKIKRLLYAYSFLNKSLTKKINLDTKYFDGLQDDLGKWHDSDVAAELLSSAGFSDKKVIKEVKTQRDNCLKAINSTAENFLEKAVL